MAGEAGFSATLDRAGSWITSLGHRSRTPTSSVGSRVFQPRNTTSIVISKGLLNAPGENNCFLNSAVQVLWHLDVFRRSFRDMAGHACMGKACIFCALKVLFTQLQYGEEKALPPDALRKALASAFKDEQRFQLGCMDDAAECFENILVRIHFHLAHDIKEDLCDAKHCVSHQKFAMTLIEHCVCPCGATSEPFPFTQMVHYVSCTALCGEAKKKREKHLLSSAFFGQLLRSAGAIGDIRECPSECGRKIHIRRVLMNCPDVVGIGLVWDSDRPSVDHIMDVISCLGTTLRLPDLFNSVVDEQAKKIALNLVGVVTYYGKHYSTFFYNTKRRLWIYFDDASVKQVGPNWRDVAERCRRGHFQPLLLLFANPNGKTVDIQTAPKDTTILPGYQHLDSPDQPRVSMPYPSSHRRLHSTSTIQNAASHSGGSLESTGAVYKSLASVPEFSASSRPAVRSSDQGRTHGHSGLNSVVEIGHDPLGGTSQRGYHHRTEPLSVDGERTLNRSSSLIRQNQQRALAMAGFACTQEYEAKSKPVAKSKPAPTQDRTLEMAGFIQTSGMPQPLMSGNYESLYSKRSQLPSRTPEPSDLLGHEDIDNWVCADGNASLPRHQQGVLLPQASQVSKTGARYSQGYRKPQNGGGAPHSHSESVRTVLESDQKRQLIRHDSWNGKDSNSKSIPIYENVVNGAITNDSTDGTEGNVSLQSRHPCYGSTPDLKKNLSETQAETEVGREHSRRISDKQRISMNRRNSDSQTLGKYDSVPDMQMDLDDAKKSSLTKNSVDADIYSSMPDLQRAASNTAKATQNIASKGILADAIKNNQEHRKLLDHVAAYSSSSSLTSSSGKGVDSKRSSQASQASTLTTDSADTSRSSGSRSGSLRSKYGVASGFVTLPRKKQISDFAEGRSEQQGRPWYPRIDGDRGQIQRSQSDPPPPASQTTPVLQQQNSAPAQFAGVFLEDDSPTPVVVDAKSNGTAVRRPSHLQHFTTTPVETAKADPLEVGSVGSKDSGYRSRDRSSASSGSVYSVDSPVENTPPIGVEGGSNVQVVEAHHISDPYRREGTTSATTSPDIARKKEVEAHCVAVSLDVEELIDKCHQREKAGDLAMALALCTAAVAKLKDTLKLDGMNDDTRHCLQCRYSTTVVKSRSLHRRLQIIRKQDRMDSIDGSTNGRPESAPTSPTSPQQPIRPASAQPMLGHNSSGNIGARSANMSKYEVQPHHQPTAVAVDLTPGLGRNQSSNTRVASHPAFVQYGTQNRGDSRVVPAQQGYNQSSATSHVTDPRTGLYRPHSAQLPRKQYDFGTQHGHQRAPSNGYHGGDRYRRSSGSVQDTDEPIWRPGASSRNPPRRSESSCGSNDCNSYNPSVPGGTYV